ncbi:MAG: alanine racemase [Oscillospiraceae bacterium]
MENNSKNFLKRTWAEIHLDRAERNFEILRSLCNESCTRAACVIKANAYGHGDVQLMRCLEEKGADFFCVSNLDEALRLRKGGCRGDILILGWTAGEYAPVLAENDIIQAVLTPEHARELGENASGKAVRAHIKLDTGMGRIGLLTSDPDRCAEEMAEIFAVNGLNVEGVFTHFAVADSFDEDNTAYTNMQKERFFGVVECAKAMGMRFKEVHCLNSAGTLIHYDRRSTLARLGIALYGLKPSEEMTLPEGIKPVMELKSEVSYIKPLHKGESVSYGRKFTADREMIAATIPVGYADGYSRLLSGKAEVLINGRRAKSIGRICMDQMIVDVTDIPDVKEGTPVTLFGCDGGETITPDDLAALYGTIGYEIVCGINRRVPRVYMKNGEITEVDEFV